jgi:hypothetical protein
VVSGVGLVAGLPDLPTDPGNVSGDDLVFRGGTVHIVTTNFRASFPVSPRSCLFSGTLSKPGGSSAVSGSDMPVSGAGAWDCVA